MKKALLAALLIIFSCQILMAQENMYINSSNGVNLREGPGTNYKIIKSVPNGSQVKALSSEGEWAKVEFEWETGYVSNQFLSKEKPRTNKSSSGNSSFSNRNNNTNNRSSSSSLASSYNRNWGIGLRMGDPSGISIKKYNGNTAWEFNIGHTAYWGRYTYREAFYNYKPYKNYRDIDIESYRTTRALGIQARHLWQKDLNIDGLSGLQWYYGLGGQLKHIAVVYRFDYEDEYGRDWNDVYDTANFINLGVDGIIGLEYTFSELPLSIFTDINLFLEVFSNPFFLHTQGGLGIRYNF
jgi:uncharacterized protein YgiM (DUF1202 family)